MLDHLYSHYSVIGTFLISAVLSYLITPLFRLIALRTAFVDHPQSKKKAHVTPVPLLGGLAIVFSFMVSIMLTTRFEKVLIPILIGAAVVVLFGLIDDKLGMMPRVKLTGQLVAALVVIRMGIKVDTIPFYYASLLFTVIWIMGITNAFNLLDNLNGLSSGIAGISAVCFGVIAWKNGQMFVATVSFALAGSCFGFLKHNFPKANIFMGDAGSMFLGFMLSCIALIGCWETERISTSLSVPILILGYPIFDTALVSIIRTIEGRSIFQGGKDHSSHILSIVRFVRNRKTAVMIIFCTCAFTGYSAYLLSQSNVYIGLGIMILAYGFLFWLFLSLLFVRLAIFKKAILHLNRNKILRMLIGAAGFVSLSLFVMSVSNAYVGIAVMLMLFAVFFALLTFLFFARFPKDNEKNAHAR
jgi:UDP-GlcNAc:undecaprenyl-phosphate GlcNAc-1-phosphate transferase